MAPGDNKGKKEPNAKDAKDSPQGSKVQSSESVKSPVTSNQKLEDDGTKPVFIYGGPFIPWKTEEPFLDTATPINMPLQGYFKKSFAYYSLKERLPVILTKVIDNSSRKGGVEATAFVHEVAKLKNHLMTNKPYELFTAKTAEAKKWNEWIGNLECNKYYSNVWVWTECYVYRRLQDIAESLGLSNLDPFTDQKEKSFQATIEPMCLAATKVVTMMDNSEKDKRKADFIALLKLSLWANKCDLSLSGGEQVALKGIDKEELKAEAPPAKGKGKKEAPPPAPTGPTYDVIDPFQLILDFKDRLLVDDSAKIADQVVVKAENMRKAVEADEVAPASSAPPSRSGSPTKAAAAAPPPPPPPPQAPPEVPPAEGAEGPKVPCPAKVTVPTTVYFDIVCDNAGYELFADLCLGAFLLAQGIVQKIRYHVKKYPWFVSDVTPKDFKYVVNSCVSANYNRVVQADPKPLVEGAPEPEADPPLVISSDALKRLGERFQQHLNDGTFLVLSDDYWTYPHAYKDMKKYDYNMYRKLQLATAILFKGDLNYRKLLAELNVVPTQSFDLSLQGFNPAPVLALRTVKADLICGLPKGRWDALTAKDPKWMEKGDYGVIQFSPKAEALKVSDKPCWDYGAACRGKGCPLHSDM